MSLPLMSRLTPLHEWGTQRLPGIVIAGVAPHLGEPAGESEKLAPLGDEEAPEVAGANVFRVQAGVGLEPPAQQRAAPWAETMAAR